MLSVNYLRENLEKAIELLKVRNIKDLSAKLNSIIATDDERKNIQQALDAILSKSNGLAKEIGSLFKEGKREEASILKQETANLKVIAIKRI